MSRADLTPEREAEIAAKYPPFSGVHAGNARRRHALPMPAGAAFARARQVIEEAARDHGVTVAQLTGPRGSRRVAEARQDAMWRVRQLTSAAGRPAFSLPFIGQLFGGRDHSSVTHALRRQAERTGRVSQ